MERERAQYYYMVRTSSGILQHYSGGFKTIKEAVKWYEKHGKVLEKLFNRKLELV